MLWSLTQQEGNWPTFLKIKMKNNTKVKGQYHTGCRI